MLNAAGNAQLAVGDDLQLDEFTFYILGIVEKVVEVAPDRFGAGVFQRRAEIINDNVGLVEAAERRHLVGAGRGHTFVLEIRDLLFGAARGESIEAYGPGQCGDCDCSEQSSDFLHFSLPQLSFPV